MRMRNYRLNAVSQTGVREDRGAALFASLGLLLVFSVLGTAYVKSMMISLEDTRYVIQNVRANHLSRGGIYAGIGEIQAGLENGLQPAGTYEIALPVYRLVEDGTASYPQTVKVLVNDESGKVNLNFAPKSLLVALGVPSDVVDEVRREARGAGGRLLVSVDNLRTRDFMNGQNYNALDKNLFTVYTGSSDGAGTQVNLNSASPAVLAAIFAIDGEEAQSLAQKRPFSSWDDVRAKVGREPSTFNVPDTARTNRGMPDAVSLSSRSFRLLSEAHMVTRDTSARGLLSAVESVVNFSDDGSFSIRYWNETPSDEAFEETEVAASAPVESTGDDAVDDSNEVTEEPEDAGSESE